MTYAYDGLGRRVTENGIADFYDGSNVVNTNRAEILHGPALDGPLVVFAPPGTSLACAVGSGPATYAITTGTGRLLDFHDVWGSDCTPYNTWSWYGQNAGAIRDSYGVGLSRSTDTTSLSYFRNRYYDARSGRFTQEDPITRPPAPADTTAPARSWFPRIRMSPPDFSQFRFPKPDPRFALPVPVCVGLFCVPVPAIVP